MFLTDEVPFMERHKPEQGACECCRRLCIVNAVEKEYQLLFNRRTRGPPLRGAQLRFLGSLAQAAALRRFVEKNPLDSFQLRWL